MRVLFGVSLSDEEQVRSVNKESGVLQRVHSFSHAGRFL